MAEQNTNTVTMTVIPEEVVAVSAIISQCGFNSKATTVINDDGSAVITLGLNNQEYDKLNMAVTRYRLKSGLSKAIDGTANVIINTAEYLAKDVAVPVTKIGVKLGAGAGRIAVESAVIAGASVVNVAAEQGQATIESIKKSEEFTKAKESLSKLGSFLGFGGGGINITKA